MALHSASCFHSAWAYLWKKTPNHGLFYQGDSFIWFFEFLFHSCSNVTTDNELWRCEHESVSGSVTYARPSSAAHIFKGFSKEGCDSLISQDIQWSAHWWKTGILEMKLFPGFVSPGHPGAGRRGMNREGVPGKSPEEMYIQQKVRVLLMLRKMGSNVRCTSQPVFCGFSGNFGLSGVVLVEMGRWWSGFNAELSQPSWIEQLNTIFA